MKFTTNREALLRPLQLVTGVVERRQTLPVLANLLVVAKDGTLSLTGTDLEVELIAVASGVTIETDRGSDDSCQKTCGYLAFSSGIGRGFSNCRGRPSDRSVGAKPLHVGHSACVRVSIGRERTGRCRDKPDRQ